MLQLRDPLLRAATLLLGSLVLASTAEAQACPDTCFPDPVTSSFGTIHPGVTLDIHFQSSTPGTAKVSWINGVGWQCPTCTPCTGTLYIEFNPGITIGSLCYTPDGGGIFATVAPGIRTTTTKTICDGDPQLIDAYFYETGVDCATQGGSSGWDFKLEARLYCYCLEEPE